MGIAENIKALREQHNMTQAEFGKIAGVSDKAVSTWENGTAEPRMGAIQKIADYFHIPKSVLIEDKGNGPYYLDPEVAEMAQELATRPEMQIMFDASRNLSKEDIEMVTSLMEKLSQK